MTSGRLLNLSESQLPLQGIVVETEGNIRAKEPHTYLGTEYAKVCNLGKSILLSVSFHIFKMG